MCCIAVSDDHLVTVGISERCRQRCKRSRQNSCVLIDSTDFQQQCCAERLIAGVEQQYYKNSFQGPFGCIDTSYGTNEFGQPCWQPMCCREFVEYNGYGSRTTRSDARALRCDNMAEPPDSVPGIDRFFVCVAHQLLSRRNLTMCTHKSTFNTAAAPLLAKQPPLCTHHPPPPPTHTRMPQWPRLTVVGAIARQTSVLQLFCACSLSTLHVLSYSPFCCLDL